MSPSRSEIIDQVISQSAFRKNIFKMVPEGARRILDFGCGSGGLLLRLLRDKGCTGLHGVELDPKVSAHLRPILDRLWNLNLEQPEADLGAEYKDFFNFILLHDVAEHLYDPWYTLCKLRQYLSPQGKLLIAVPNLQHWDFLYKILEGKFLYGHGLWHLGHIRWYTYVSFIELLLVSGYEIEQLLLEIPYAVDLNRVRALPGLRTVQFPPVEIQAELPETRPISVTFERDMRRAYPLFLAHKLMAVCRKGPGEIALPPFGDNCDILVQARGLLDLPFDMDHLPAMTELVGDWC